MAEIEFNVAPLQRKADAPRRPLDVLGIEDVGASRRGSTYYKTLLSCPREFALRNVVGLRLEQEQKHFTVGKLFHYAMQVFYASQRVFQQQYEKEHRHYLKHDDYYWLNEPAAAKAAYKAILPVSEEPGYEDIWEEVERVVDAYLDYYMGRDRFRVIAEEETLEYISQHYDYTARIDLIVQDMKDRRMWIIEHKSAKVIGLDLLESYQMDWQILGQVFLVQRCVDLDKYPRFGGVRVNIASKHKTPRLVRHDVCPSQAHIDDFEHQMVAWMSVQENMERLGWPKSLGHCSGYARGYSRCTYYEVCHGFPAASVTDISEWKDAPHRFVFKDLSE